MTRRTSNVRMSEMSDSDAIRTGVNVRNVRCVLDTGRTDTSDTGHGQNLNRTGKPPFRVAATTHLPEFGPDARLLQATFGCSVYATAPVGDYGHAPDWQAHGWMSHLASDMGPPPVAHADLARQSKGRRK